MKLSLLRTFVIVTVAISSIAGVATYGQTVFNPNDVNVEYSSRNPPTQPVSGPGKWVKTGRMSWSTSSYKCYIYKGIAFRLKYPKTYVAGNGIKYPLFVFFHGAGESGSIYDNEYQLYHGGQLHSQAVDNGQFEGFLLYPQCTNRTFSVPELNTITELIEQYLIPQVQVDPFRIIADGLSGGGAATWGTFMRNPKLFAASLPISNAEYSYMPYLKANKFNAIWLFQGALDPNPPVVRTHKVRDTALAAGGNLRYTEYPTRGHDCWYQAWGEPDYFPFITRAHKANPWPEGGRTEFCPQEVVKQLIGVTAGFTAYEWRRNDTLIAGAAGNTITATSLGKYDCRVKRGTEWSPWSPIPVVLKLKTTSESPLPQLANFSSNVLPAPDGTTKVQLEVAEGYSAYKWTATGSATVLSTTNTYVAGAGSYQVTITEKFGCQSTASNPYTVINANGPNKPDVVNGLIVNRLSKTSLKLFWIANANAVNPTTNFEIYQASKAGGPYQFVGVAGAAEHSFTKVELTPGTKYFYIVRAVNNTSAAAVSAEVSATTDMDNQPPTSPANLKVTGTTRNAISLQWDEAGDDAAIAKYDVYVNGVKSYSTPNTYYTIYNLDYNTLYNITVKAKDLTGNESVASNQVSAKTVMNGLMYKYYVGDWDKLPDFNLVPLEKSGFASNVTLANRTQEEGFAFLWEGFIRITTSGNYTFRTNSNDGSRLYINTPYSYTATPLVNNDAVHNAQNKDGTISLTAGVYPIVISYFQKTTASSMTVSWKLPGSNSFVTIPNSAFTETASGASGVPNAPSGLTANAVSFRQVGLSWNDNSNNETGFEVARATEGLNDFNTLAVLPANSTGYQDSTAAASTKYYYKVRSINQNGQSAYDRSGTGVDYAYYETNTLSSIPDFTTLTPVKTGKSSDFSLGMADRPDNFAVKFEGTITVPSTGSYKFYTSSDAGSRLYINGNSLINNDGIHAETEKSSNNISLTAGTPVSIMVTYFEATGSEALTVSYQKTSSGTAVNKQVIPSSVLGQAYVTVTTPDAPPPPAAPVNLNAVLVEPTKITVGWTNSDANVASFEVYRSYENNEEYVLYATVAASSSSYTDLGLFPNTTVYYKVRALSAAGSSDYSNEINVVTPGIVPALDTIEDKFMRFSSQLQVYVNATTTTSDVLTLQASNLPAFAGFAVTGNGKGVITFNPGQNDQGTYNGITVTVTDPKNNISTRTFNLGVNDNYVPVVADQSAVTVNENQTQQVTLNATDSDAGDALTWSFTGLPSFVTITQNNRSVQLNIAPVSGNAGIYNIIAKADDGRNGTDTVAFSISVGASASIIPVYIHLSASAAYLGGGAWNSIAKVLAPNEVFPATTKPGFKDQNGVATDLRMSINFEAGLTNIPNYSGLSTGANTGVYPDKVLQAGYKFSYTKRYVVSFSGLQPGRKYNFTFLGSFNATSTADLSTKYRINGDSVLLNSLKNTQNTITITNVSPNADGTLELNISKGPVNTSAFYYINAIVISDGGTANTAPPSKPGDFRTVYEGGLVKITWTNTAAVINSNEVYRSTSKTGTYTLLNTGNTGATLQSYNDSTAQPNNTYYYFVKANNSNGGTNTDTLSVFVPNKPPVITDKEIYIKTNQTTDVNVQAIDNAGDVITLKTSGLPSFITFMDNGDGTGTLHAVPLAGNTGVFTATVTATDNQGESASATIKFYITDQAVTSTYVNFNVTIPVAGIWNSFNKTPAANATISGLKNDLGVPTTASVTLPAAWTSGVTGAITGNNSGAFRDDVLQTFYAETSTATKTVQVKGLSTDANVRYNLVFVSSINATDDRTTIFTSGGKTVTINAAGNSQKTIQLNDLTATDGVLEYTVTKGPTAIGAYMNALVIQSYTSSTTLLAPDNFKAMGIAKDSIKLAWNNRVNAGTVEIYRSTSANGTFNFVTAVSGGVSTYTDYGLPANTEYFYKLKAVSAPGVSPFSNTISASTFAYSVFINFNRDNPAASPWNNTNSDPQAGVVYSFLYTDQKNYSGIAMTVGEGFSATNALGENTGNNSGIVPDNVMRSTWWADIGQFGQLKFSGLSQNMSYSFTFFASRTAADTRVTNYIINGKVVKLKVNSNRMLTVTMDNVYADENGEVMLTVQPELATQFSYIGGLIISGGKKPSNPIEGTGGAVFRGSIGNATSGAGNGAITDADLPSTSKLNIYPNPFRDDVMVKLNLANNVSKLMIKVTDVSGRIVMTKIYSDLKKGNWQQTVGLDQQHLPAGVYFIQVQGLKGETLAPIRLLKTK